jgi:hypothetical protein
LARKVLVNNGFQTKFMHKLSGQEAIKSRQGNVTLFTRDTSPYSCYSQIKVPVDIISNVDVPALFEGRRTYWTDDPGKKYKIY